MVLAAYAPYCSDAEGGTRMTILEQRSKNAVLEFPRTTLLTCFLPTAANHRSYS
jgi:hypothetical protein